MTGKSQAQLFIAKARYDIDNNIRIGVHCKSTYKRLIAQGIPEANLVKMWEKVYQEPTLWWEEM